MEPVEDNTKQGLMTEMETDAKRLLARLYADQREDFAIIFRIMYQWKVETAVTKSFAQLFQSKSLTSEDTQEIVQELHKRLEGLDISLANCLSIADSLPVK